MRFLLWITEPSMIKGMAMGIVLALVVSVAFRLESMWFVASSVLTLVVMCLFGVLIGNYVFESRRKRMQRQGLALVRQAGGELPGLSDDLMYLLVNRDRNHLPVLWQRLGRIQPAIEEFIGLTLAAVFRVMAMSTLFAVLGGAISFAVFLASYMQVERMEAQNKLIGEQIRQADEQMRFAKEQQQIEVALSIAEHRQVAAREALAVINNDRGPAQAGKRSLSPTAANLVAVALSQLEPYRGVTVDPDTGDNILADHITSPEQEQLVRYLAAANVNLTELDLSRAFLDDARLHDIDLAHIQLPRVRLRRAVVHDTNFAGANLAGADLSLAVMSRSDLSGANLATARLHWTNLVGAKLADTNLAEADLALANLRGAALNNTQFGRARLCGAKFSGVDVGGADLSEADLALADFETATLPQVPKIRSANFWWLGVYPQDYAARLGLGAEDQARNKTGLDRLRMAPGDPVAVSAIIDELKAAAPHPPA